MNRNGKVPSSFRDPSGHVFWRNGELYRQVNYVYKKEYEHLMESGLFESLVSDGLLIRHDTAHTEPDNSEQAYLVIRPEVIPFVSYPYEWCFSQLKDAALTTLAIQNRALDFGMILKDASAYNIQFKDGRPIFIDTLSFDMYQEGRPWVAYKQFCQHFLGPLSLMSSRDIRLNQLLRVFIDGIPLDLVRGLLPVRKFITFPFLLHIYLHARSQKKYAQTALMNNQSAKNANNTKRRISLNGMKGLIDSLQSAIQKLKWEPYGTEWGDYYNDTNYSDAALRHKMDVVTEFIDATKPDSVWDLGANTGVFSRIASCRGIPTISFDIDPAAVEKNYLDCAEKKEKNLLPLTLDLTNPSPGIGWQNLERSAITDRGPADAVLALALIHHLSISNNVPFRELADFLSNISNSLIIEFIPKSDSQVQRLLSSRQDVFPDYTRTHFEKEFRKLFAITDCRPITGSERVLYLMHKKPEPGS